LTASYSVKFLPLIHLTFHFLDVRAVSFWHFALNLFCVNAACFRKTKRGVGKDLEGAN